MDQAGVHVLEKVHVRGAEAGVVIEVIGGGDGGGDLRQLHHSDLTRSHEERWGCGGGGPRGRLIERGLREEDWDPRGKLWTKKETGIPRGSAILKTTAVGGKEEEKPLSGNVKLVWTLWTDT